MSYQKNYPNGWQSGEAGGTPITPAALDNIEKGIANALPKDGTDPMTADLPMDGHRVTGLGEPAANGDAVPLGFANEKFFSKTGGTVNGATTVRRGLLINTLDDVGCASVAGISGLAFLEAYQNGQYGTRRQFVLDATRDLATGLRLTDVSGDSAVSTFVVTTNSHRVAEVSAVSGAIIFRKINNVVYVSIPTGFAEIGKVAIPEGYRPTRQLQIPCIYTDADYISHLGTAQWNTSGTIVIKDSVGNVAQSGWFNVVTAYHITQD